MIKPSGTDGDIAFGGDPCGALPFAGIETLAVAAGIAATGIQCGPARIARDAVLISNPADIGASIAEYDGFGHQLADNLKSVGPMIVDAVINLPFFSRATVETVAAVCAVEPDTENVAVIGEQFAQLIAVIGEVFGPAIIFMIAIPGR